MVTTSPSSHLEEVGEYKPGSIRKIKLRNFLTYSDVEISPGPRMNMVVGPNGTGKSSILCAICLALGGDPHLLGRADDARTFIMNNETMAILEIELEPFPDKETHVIRRTIDRDKGSEKGQGRGASTYYINEERVTQKEVRKLAQETYHISIDNLCTFLPQDKVGNFSDFDQKTLLVETEKTLSKTQHLYNDHQRLIQAEADLRGGFHDVSTVAAKLEKLKQENARLEREKDRMEERQVAIEQARLLEKKLLWLQFEQLREEVINLKKDKVVLRNRLRDAHTTLLPLQEKLTACQEQKDEMDENYRKMEQTTQRLRKEMEKQRKKYDTHDEAVESILVELHEIDSRRTRNQETYDKLRERVELLESELDAFPSQEQVNADCEQAVQERRRLARVYQSAKQDVQTHRNQLKEFEDEAQKLQNKLARMADDKSRRNERIFQQQPNLNKINRWLGQNRNIFRRPVWGPIVCEVTMKSEQAAMFLEQHVANNVLKAFIVEDKQDYDKLYREVRTKFKLPINVILVANGTLEPLRTRIYSDEKMEILKRDHGVLGYLDESFTAPDAVMQALLSHAMVDKVLVGSEKTKESVATRGLLDFLSEPDAKLGQKGHQKSVIFAHTSKYTTIISRYGNKLPSTRTDDNISAAKWLARGVDPKVKEILENQLAEAHERISNHLPLVEEAGQKLAECEVEAQQAAQKAQEAKQNKDELTKFHSKLQNARRRAKEAQEALNADDDNEKKALMKNLMNRINHSIASLESHATFHEQMMESTYSSAGAKVSKDVCVTAEKSISRELDEKRQEFEELNHEVQRVQELFTSKKRLLASYKKKADAAAQLIDDAGNELPIKAELEALPYDTLEEVEAALEEAETKANSIIANPDVIRQYEQRKTEIETVQAKLDELKGSKESKLVEIEQIKKPWESALRNSVDKINILFSNYMADLDYTGEVALKDGGGISMNNINQGNSVEHGSFKDWGIEIRVSFRKNTRAQVLSARVQSGGERAVSTIMYLMALQELMVSPFRCVDEINQGLDDRNERLVFKRIVENSTRKPKPGTSLTQHSGQYFLITPKLLPNLYDMEAEGVTVLFVFNGPFNYLTPSGWDVDHLVSMRRRGPVSSSQKRTRPTLDDESEDENSPINVNTNALSSPSPAKKRGRRLAVRPSALRR